MKQFAEDEKLEQPSDVARKILAIGLEKWRQEKALNLLEKGKVTFLKAAKIARLNAWDFADLLKERKIVWVKDAAVKEDLAKA